MSRGLSSDQVNRIDEVRSGDRRSNLLRVSNNFNDIKLDWLALEKEANASPFQTLNWCEKWWHQVGAENGDELALVSGAGPDGKVGFILPLILKKVGPVSIAQSLGDKNAAYLNPIYKSAYLKWVNREGPFSLTTELKFLFPEVDAFVLDAQVSGFDREPELIGEFRQMPTGNTVSFVGLDNDWVDFDKGRRSSKTRSKERNRENRLKKMGDFEFRVADNLDERMEMFDALVKQKSTWFKNHCIEDVFACENKLAFLRELATQTRQGSDKWSLLSGLRLNGEWISLNFGVVHGDHYAGLILSTGEGEAKRFSPGHLLITKTMQFCSENGIAVFNFGAGDNDIKAKWTDDSRQLTLATMSTSLKGHIYEMVLRKIRQVKSELKSNPFLWRRFKHLRALSVK